MSSLLKKKRAYWAKAIKQNPGSAYIRMQLDAPGYTRLILPCHAEGESPLQIWIDWGNRCTKRYKHRLPGNWKTKRGIKKRKQFMVRHLLRL